MGNGHWEHNAPKRLLNLSETTMEHGFQHFRGTPTMDLGCNAQNHVFLLMLLSMLKLEEETRQALQKIEHIISPTHLKWAHKWVT
jgi:hypothetical protein